MEAILLHHPVDLSGRVQRWRADPEALPAIIRDSHRARAADPQLRRPAAQPVKHNRPSPVLTWMLAVFATYVVIAVLIGLHAGGKL